jgi:alanine dehydrogenase
VDIGIPRETRPGEHRVALAPPGVKALTQHGHRVWVETGAGAAAGYPDAEYEAAGATVVFSRLEPFARAELVASVFAPEPADYGLLRPEQTVFAFWALPTVRPEDLRALLGLGITAVGLEAIEDDLGHAPVLTSMSEIAGSLAVTVSASLLLSELGGKGIVLGGAPGVPPANFVILGAGVAGRAAARSALGLGAAVTLLDREVAPLREVTQALRGVATMLATRPNVEKALSFADVVLGAVARHGERAPVIVTRAMLGAMRPRSVVVDLAIDMGGCFETSRPTAFPDAAYEVDGIVHFCVPNLPSTAARSSTLALTNALLPYLIEVAGSGLDRSLDAYPELLRGTYLSRGRCFRESLVRAFDLPADGDTSGPRP